MTVNLYEKIVFYDRAVDLPVMVIMDGWDGAVESSPVNLLRIARSYNVAVCSTARRGFASTNGNRDASGREIYDIYDGLQQVRSLYPERVSSTKAILFGFSGGGGNALAAACKFPDAFSVIVSCYGMSDYGRDGTNGWHQQNASYRAAIATAVGGAPADVPNNYYARDATAAITNYSGGRLFLFHDVGDTVVPPIHSARIETAMAGLGNCTRYLSQVGDGVRYTHTGSLTDAAQSDIESKIMPTVLSQPAWTIPASGTITVIGYIVTKRFSIWLNSGLDAAATVVYDTAAGTYTVTPLTSNAVVAVSITQGALTASGNTNGETTFTVA